MAQLKCVLSGSNGFIGKALTERLAQLKHTVVPINRELLSDSYKLRRFFIQENPDFIFHLAVYGNMASQQDEEEIFRANVIGTWNMLQASKDIKYKAFINISSSSVGLEYETFYSATKAAGERLVRAFVNKYDKPIVNVRPFSVYGPGEADFRFIPTVCRCIIKNEILHLDPMPKHDWIYIDDVINLIVAILDNPKFSQGLIYEVGTAKQYSNGKIVSMLEKIAGKKVKHGVFQYGQRTFDNLHWKAKEAVPHIEIEEGLRKTYEYYKEKYEKN